MPRKFTRFGFDAFEHRDFSVFWTTAIISNSANWMQSIVIPFIIFDITDSNTWVGAVWFTILVPALIFTPIAGVIADKVPRHRVLLATTIAQMLVAAGFVFFWQTDGLTPWIILMLSLIQGVSAGIQTPNWQSLVPQLVPRENLFSAIRLNSAQFTAARAIGPLLGAVLLNTYGAGAVFTVNFTTYLFMTGALLYINPTIMKREMPQRAMAALKEGFRFVKKRPAIWQATLTAFAMSFFGGSLPNLAAGLASEEFNVGSEGFAGLVTANGVGAIVGSFMMITMADRYSRSSLISVGLAFYGAGPLIIAATQFYAFGLLGYFFTGVAHLMVGISINTAVQSQLPENIRGRVLSIYLMGIFAGLPFGAFAGGYLGDLIGLRIVFVVYGFCLFLYIFLITILFNRLNLLNQNLDE